MIEGSVPLSVDNRPELLVSMRLLGLLLLVPGVLGWPCGQVELNSSQYCDCGGSLVRGKTQYQEGGEWCCPAPQTGCQPASNLSQPDYVCPGASLQPWSQPCRGQCPPGYLCSRAETCLTQADITCHGYDCAAGAELCNGTIRKEGEFSELCQLTPGRHQEFYMTRTERNNLQYDCLSRSDEDFSRETKEYFSNIYRLTNCSTNKSQPGLQCEEGCLVNYEWCRAKLSSSCTINNITVRTNDTGLCQQPLIQDRVSHS